jgi:hypothetical protein
VEAAGKAVRQSVPIQSVLVARVVVVALVVVELEAVKFCSVEEPVTKRLETVLKTEVRKPMKPVLERIWVVEARLET